MSERKVKKRRGVLIKQPILESNIHTSQKLNVNKLNFYVHKIMK